MSIPHHSYRKSPVQPYLTKQNLSNEKCDITSSGAAKSSIGKIESFLTGVSPSSSGLNSGSKPLTQRVTNSNENIQTLKKKIKELEEEITKKDQEIAQLHNMLNLKTNAFIFLFENILQKLAAAEASYHNTTGQILLDAYNSTSLKIQANPLNIQQQN